MRVRERVVFALHFPRHVHVHVRSRHASLCLRVRCGMPALTRAHTCLTYGRRAQDCTPVCGRKIDAVTEEDLLLYVLLSSNLALGYSTIL